MEGVSGEVDLEVGEVDLEVGLEEDLEVDQEVDYLAGVVDQEELLYLEDLGHLFIVDPVLDLALEEDKLSTPMDLDLVSSYWTRSKK